MRAASALAALSIAVVVGAMPAAAVAEKAPGYERYRDGHEG